MTQKTMDTTNQPTDEELQEAVDQENGVPEEEAKYFQDAYVLTVNNMTRLANLATEYQMEINTAKTKPKKNLYNKKFYHVKKEFQDELGRYLQLRHILQENDIEEPVNFDLDNLMSAGEQE